MFRATITTLSFLSFLSLSVCEDRVFTPATNTGLRGAESDEALDLTAVTSGPLLAAKARLALNSAIPSDLLSK